LKNATVRDIRNQIVSQHRNGASIVQQPPWTMGKDLGYGLWKVLEYDRTDAECGRKLLVWGFGLQALKSTGDYFAPRELGRFYVEADCATK
jgi:hypothetical protein